MKSLNNQLAVHNKNRTRTVEVTVDYWEIRPKRVYRSVVLMVGPGQIVPFVSARNGDTYPGGGIKATRYVD